MESPALRWIQVRTAYRSHKDTFDCFDKKGWIPIFWSANYPTPLSISTPSLPVFHCLFFSLSLSSVCLSSRVLHPDQSGILSRLLWSLHHNYGAVGTGEIRDGKKRKSGKKRQMKCRSVEMCSGQFLSLFLSVSLSPWATAKEAKRDRGWKCLSPTPASLLPRTDGLKLRQCYLSENSNDRRCWAWH